MIHFVDGYRTELNYYGHCGNDYIESNEIDELFYKLYNLEQDSMFIDDPSLAGEIEMCQQEIDIKIKDLEREFMLEHRDSIRAMHGYGWKIERFSDKDDRTISLFWVYK